VQAEHRVWHRLSLRELIGGRLLCGCSFAGAESRGDHGLGGAGSVSGGWDSQLQQGL